MLFKSHSLMLAACGSSAIVAFGCVSFASAGVTFSDSFNRATTSAAYPGTSPNPIGNGWVIPSSDTSGWQISASPSAGAANNVLEALASNGNTSVMVNPSAETPAGGFTLSAEVATPVPATTDGDAALVFNYQNASNYCFLRVISGAGGGIQMFNVVNGSENWLGGGATWTTGLTANTFYQLTVSDSGGVYAYSLSTIGNSPTVLGSSQSGDSTFTGGYGGVGQQASTVNDYFSNFTDTYTPVPEPASLGLVGVGALGLLLIGRKRKVV